MIGRLVSGNFENGVHVLGLAVNTSASSVNLWRWRIQSSLTPPLISWCLW